MKIPISTTSSPSDEQPEKPIAPTNDAPLSDTRPSETDSLSSKKSQQTPAAQTIELSISLPSLPVHAIYNHLLSRAKQTPLPQGKSTRLALVSCVTLGVVAGGFLLTKLFNNSDSTGQAYALHQLPKGNPEFNAITPAGKNINQLGGWTRISPPDRNAVYTFTDSINDTSINVSQQPLPDAFITNTQAQVEQLATSFLATEKITTGSTTFYIGTSSNGAQSVILTKNQLLILIKSTGKIDTADWTDYINSLR